MWKATIRGLFARKVRLALTALAILLGVAFVTATYVLTDSVKRSFESVFAQTLTGVDLQVQGTSALGDGSSPGASPTPRDRPGRGRSRACARRRDSCAPRWPSSSTRTATPSAVVDHRRSASRGSTTGRCASPTVTLPTGRPGGDGRRHRREARLPRRRSCARAAERSGEGVRDRRAVRVRRHHRLRRGDVRRVRPRHRADASSTPPVPSTRSTSSATRRHHRRIAGAHRGRRSARATRCSPRRRRRSRSASRSGSSSGSSPTRAGFWPLPR